MKTNELIKALNHMKVQTGSLMCLGCGHEHSCGLHGCAIIREAVNKLCRIEWINTKIELPPDGEPVLAVVSGRPHKNITLQNAIATAGYFDDGGWLVDEFPQWDNPEVTYWMPLPEPPKED